MLHQREYGENDIMGDAPVAQRRHILLPPIDDMSFDDLTYIDEAVDAYSRDVKDALVQKREERIAELKARIAEDHAALADLCPAPVMPANPSTPKYRDPDKPENTWAGRGKQPGWLKEKLEAGASLADFLIG